MKYKARYDWIAKFAGESFINPHSLIEVELLEEENISLKKLVNGTKISESFLGELAWYLAKAKRLAEEENYELSLINSFREILYKPVILSTDTLKPDDKRIIFDKHIENEKGLSDKFKIERDRKLYKDISTWINSSRRSIKTVKLNIKGIEIKLESDNLLERISEALPKAMPPQLEYIIERIGIDDQNINKPKIKFYIERKDFSSNLYRFLTFLIQESKINLLGGGILYLAGFTFPFQTTYKGDIETFNFNNINDKNNKRYSDYFRDISKTDILVKAERQKKHLKN